MISFISKPCKPVKNMKFKWFKKNKPSSSETKPVETTILEGGLESGSYTRLPDPVINVENGSNLIEIHYPTNRVSPNHSPNNSSEPPSYDSIMQEQSFMLPGQIVTEAELNVDAISTAAISCLAETNANTSGESARSRTEREEVKFYFTLLITH